MRRMNVSFQVGTDTIIVDCLTSAYYSYRQQRDTVHEIFGGDAYYTSKSGLSGSGYLDRYLERLLLVGIYRDTKDQQGRIVYKWNDREIWGYFPIRNMEIDDSKPAVLSDGNTVVFFKLEYFTSVLNDFISLYPLGENYKKKEIVYRWYDWAHNERHSNFSLYIQKGCPMGVDALRFVDLEIPGGYEYGPTPTVQEHELGSLMRIVSRGNYWYHVNKSEFLDRQWEENPRHIEGEIVDGWMGMGDYTYWRREGTHIHVFVEKPFLEIGGGIYGEFPKGKDKPYFFFEIRIPLTKWFEYPDKPWVYKEKYAKEIERLVAEHYVGHYSYVHLPYFIDRYEVEKYSYLPIVWKGREITIHEIISDNSWVDALKYNYRLRGAIAQAILQERCAQS